MALVVPEVSDLDLLHVVGGKLRAEVVRVRTDGLRVPLKQPTLLREHRDGSELRRQCAVVHAVHIVRCSRRRPPERPVFLLYRLLGINCVGLIGLLVAQLSKILIVGSSQLLGDFQYFFSAAQQNVLRLRPLSSGNDDRCLNRIAQFEKVSRLLRGGRIALGEQFDLLEKVVVFKSVPRMGQPK